MLYLNDAGSPLVDRVDFRTASSCWNPLYSRIRATAAGGSIFSNFFASKRLTRQASSKAASRWVKRSTGVAGAATPTLETLVSEEDEEDEDGSASGMVSRNLSVVNEISHTKR